MCAPRAAKVRATAEWEGVVWETQGRQGTREVRSRAGQGQAKFGRKDCGTWLNVGYARTYLAYLCYRIQRYRFVCQPSPQPLLYACLEHHSGAAFAIRKG